MELHATVPHDRYLTDDEQSALMDGLRRLGFDARTAAVVVHVVGETPVLYAPSVRGRK